jgi:PAS domain S-box-containing protein
MLNHEHPELADAKYVVFVDASRRYVDCSAAVCDLLGYTPEEILQKTIDDISYEGKVRELFARYLENREQSGEYILQRKDRTPVPIHYQAFVFDDGCKAAVWEPIRDWRQPYFAALLEVDAQKQKVKIDEALAAIRQRRGSDGATKKAQDDATLMLNTLRNRRK